MVFSWFYSCWKPYMIITQISEETPHTQVRVKTWLRFTDSYATASSLLERCAKCCQYRLHTANSPWLRFSSWADSEMAAVRCKMEPVLSVAYHQTRPWSRMPSLSVAAASNGSLSTRSLGTLRTTMSTQRLQNSKNSNNNNSGGIFNSALLHESFLLVHCQD